MKKLIIANGYSGSGKTTTVSQFAKKHDFVVIKQDTFLFELNAIKNPRKELTEEEYILTQKNMLCCVKNYIKYKKNIIIEGALVAISSKDSLDIGKFLSLGKKNNYGVKVISFTASDNIRHRRMKKRKAVVPKGTDKRLKDATESMNSKMVKVKTIDTSNLSRREVLKRFEKLVL